MIPKYVANPMDAEHKVIHRRLEAWGNWAREHIQGFPARTLLARVIEEGAHGAPNSRPPISLPEAIAITDQAVARLSARDKNIVTEYYQRWEPAKALARRLHVSERDLMRNLQISRIRIGSYIEILEEKFATVTEHTYKSTVTSVSVKLTP